MNAVANSTVQYLNTINEFNVEESILKSEELRWWILSFEDYMADYNAKADKRWAARQKNVLEDFRGTLSCMLWKDSDPIRFFIYLYFQLEHSLDDVFEISKKHWLKLNSPSTLWKMFTINFWWDLRWVDGWKKGKEKREWNWQLDKAKAGYKKTVLEKYGRIKNIFSKNVWDVIENWVYFSEEYFESLWKWEKILYLLSILLGVWIYDLVRAKNQWIWPVIIANRVNEEIKPFLEYRWIKLEITAKNISDIISKAQNP